MKRLAAPLIGLMALIGLVDSVYLMLRHVGLLTTAPFEVASTCELANGACANAASSDVGSVFGIPAAVLGGLYFAAIVVIVIVRLHYGRWLFPYATLAFLGAGLGYSAYLVYLLIVVMDQPCGYCLAAHSINIVVFLIYALTLRGDIASTRMAS
jgi:uncharacterized membrane protein